MPAEEKKTPIELERFNRDTLSRRPTGENLTAFQTLRTKITPDRTDVTTWPDLLDLDESRSVPKRTAGI